MRDMGNGKVRSVGIAMAMQGSCISNLDVGSATIKVNDDGGYTMLIAAADMGTGCDTILSQMAAECLECDVDDITVVGADTDTSPYDSGSYASSTTYITGKAVEKACMTLRKRICALAAERMNVPEDETEFTGTGVVHEKSGSSMTMEEIATAAMCNNGIALEATESNCSPVSPPPYMAGAVEIELDKETGEVRILDYAAVVDCGTVINPNLARVQVEGGLVQGIGMTLFENIQYTDKGQMINNSFMQYKVPTRLDMGKLRVEFRSSYERPVRSVQNRSARSSSTHRLRRWHMQSTMRRVCGSANCRSRASRLQWELRKKNASNDTLSGSREQQTVRGK